MLTGGSFSDLVHNVSTMVCKPKLELAFDFANIHSFKSVLLVYYAVNNIVCLTNYMFVYVPGCPIYIHLFCFYNVGACCVIGEVALCHTSLISFCIFPRAR